MKLFAIREYRHLFSAQVIALFGTGLATVALGLLAYDLAGPSAGAALVTAPSIKMLMYVVLVPVAGAYAERSSLTSRPRNRSTRAHCRPPRSRTRWKASSAQCSPP